MPSNPAAGTSTRPRTLPSAALGSSAEDALAAAFAGDQKLDSGRFSVRLRADGFDAAPRLNGALVDVVGSFQGHGIEAVPDFDIDMAIAAGGERAEVGAVSLGDRCFLTRGDKANAVPSSVMSSIEEARGRISDSPRRFRRPLDRKRQVVLFFSQGAADDDATAAAVHSLAHSKEELVVLEDDVDNVDA